MFGALVAPGFGEGPIGHRDGRVFQTALTGARPCTRQELVAAAHSGVLDEVFTTLARCMAAAALPAVDLLPAVEHAILLMERARPSRTELNRVRRLSAALLSPTLATHASSSLEQTHLERGLARLASATALKFGALHGMGVHHRRVPFLFVHVSKAGGTSLCSLAKSAGVRVPSPATVPGDGGLGGTCFLPGDGPDWIWGGGVTQLSCPQRASRFAAFSLEMMMLERPLDNGGALCDEFIYGVMLREPVARSVSFINEFMGDILAANPLPTGAVSKSALLDALLAEPCGDATVSGSAAFNHTLLSPAQLRFVQTASWGDLCGQLSNAHAHSLLGRQNSAVGNRLVGQTQLLAKAEMALLNYSLVLPLETPETEASALLSHVLGWNQTQLPHERKRAAAQTFVSLDELSPMQRQRLEALNVADSSLHSLAKSILRGDLSLFERVSWSPTRDRTP